MKKKAIVLMNMGASRNKEEFKTFLKNMFNDEAILNIKNKFLRKIIAFFIVRKIYKKNWENFKKIGGASPMHEITEKLVKILQKKLPDFFVTYSMRYTKPFGEEVIEELKKKNIKEVFLFPLYPHNSIATNISSLLDFEKKAKNFFILKKAKPFYKNKNYNNIIIENIIKKIQKKDISSYHFIFSAHSMPQKIINLGDSYEKHIKENVEILKKMFKENNLGFASVSLAYQSKVGKQKWLEPSLGETFKKFSGKKVIIYPISFIIDNSETIYELDIEYKKIAKDFGVKEYLRVETINDNEKFGDLILEELNIL